MAINDKVYEEEKADEQEQAKKEQVEKEKTEQIKREQEEKERAEQARREQEEKEKAEQATEEQLVATCNIKGNISDSGEKIYHVHGGRYYDVTEPEETFCSESAAKAAGYRKSKL